MNPSVYNTKSLRIPYDSPGDTTGRPYDYHVVTIRVPYDYHRFGRLLHMKTKRLSCDSHALTL
eukprot:6357677-Pyramimonas_sp.AAC.1